LHILLLLACNTTPLTTFTNRILIVFIALLFVSVVKPANAQWYKIRGFVYDSSRLYTIESVSVLSTSGTGAVTNRDGYYEIEVTEKDSIWFSYLNKPTIRFPVIKIINPLGFDVSIHINIPELKEVKVRPGNYRLDSIQNRIEYAKIFDFEKPKIRPRMTPGGFGAGAGIDLEELINMFRFRRNKSILSFQQRLLEEEKDKFVNNRFSKALVLRLTGLAGEERDRFMLRCRPAYEFCLLASDYDFQAWIKACFEKYKKEKAAF
jgi:hypothetical protein